jgi:AraC family transcriptional regulator
MAEPLSASVFATVLPTVPRASAAWSPFAVHVVEAPQSFSGTFSDHVLTLEDAGSFRARQSVAGRWREGWCRPGAVGLVPAQRSMVWETIDLPESSCAVSLFIPDAFLSRVMTQDSDVGTRRIEIAWQFLGRDPVAEGVLRSLALEAQYGSPLGQLYAESACEFLAHHVLRTYSSWPASTQDAKGGLSGRRLRMVMDYIHDNLGQSISLHNLAELAGISPRHFERAFRQAVGVPPHAYVTEQRVAAARRLLLAEPASRVGDIAMRVGFSSSSHLATAFKRRIGHSPRKFRTLYSR